MRCKLCDKLIQGAQHYTVVQHYHVPISHLDDITELNRDVYHKLCFNKNFIYREDKPDRDTCLCNKRLGRNRFVLQVDNKLVYHLDCFHKYWMPHYRKNKKRVNYRKWSTATARG